MAEPLKSLVNSERDPAMQAHPGGNIRGLFQIYVRVLAGLYIMMGLGAWAGILGISGARTFMQLGIEQRSAEAFFAVADLVAAVGLWMLSSWGVVVWMACAIAETSLNIFFPKAFSFELLPVSFNVLSLVFYFIFTLVVAREE